MKLELVATATFGLEAVVRREIEALGYKVIKTEDGRVTYMGDERAIVRSNLWLRTADRVYVRMGEFRATEFEDLFQQTKASNPDLSPFESEICVIEAERPVFWRNNCKFTVETPHQSPSVTASPPRGSLGAI